MYTLSSRRLRPRWSGSPAQESAWILLGPPCLGRVGNGGCGDCGEKLSSAHWEICGLLALAGGGGGKKKSTSNRLQPSQTRLALQYPPTSGHSCSEAKMAFPGGGRGRALRWSHCVSGFRVHGGCSHATPDAQIAFPVRPGIVCLSLPPRLLLHPPPSPPPLV